jgi:ankyrin repeat protein/beta-lactamase regulating signal transducer with metallopeptidase domain
MVPDWMDQLGWVLIHFLWQGALIGCVASILAALLRRSSAQIRYLVLCGALLACGLAPCLTWIGLSENVPVHIGQPASLKIESAGPTATTASFVKPAPIEAPAALPTEALVHSNWSLQSFSRAIDTALPYLVVFWCLGVIILSLRLVFGWIQLRAICRSGIPVLDKGWVDRLAVLSAQMGIRRAILLLESARVEVPTVMGWLKPVLLVPAAFFTSLPPNQIEAILAHELAHIRRHDYLVNLVQIVIETLLFYHPAVWWISRALRQERENCCDDIALQIVGDKITYATALATLEESRSLPMAITLAVTGGSLLHRIRRIVGVNNRRVAAWPLWVLMIGILSAGYLIHSQATKAPDTIKPATSRAEALREAVLYGKSATVKTLIDQGLDPIKARGDHPDQTLLFLAGSSDVAEILIQHGVDVNARSKNGETALDSICIHEKHPAEIVRVLLNHGADPNARDNFGGTPLGYAPDSTTVDLLVEHGADVKAKNKNDLGVIFSSRGDASRLKALIAHGAPFDPKADGPTMMMQAAWLDHVDVIAYLLSLDVDPNQKGTWNKEANMYFTPLQESVTSGHLDAAKFLLEHGAKVGPRLIDGKPGPDDMVGAIYNRRKDIVKLFWEHGVRSISELTYAISQGEPVSEIQKILDSGIPPDPPQDKFISPLALAAELGQLDVVTLLVQRGAKINGHVEPEAPPIDQAAGEGQDEVVDYLLQNGAKVDYQAIWNAAWNCNPYDDQRSKDHFERTVKLLIDAGTLKKTTPEQNGNILSAAVDTRYPGGNITVLKMLLDAGLSPELPLTDESGKKLNSVIGFYRDLYIKHKDDNGWISAMKPQLDMLEAADKGSTSKAVNPPKAIDVQFQMIDAARKGDAVTLQKLFDQGVEYDGKARPNQPTLFFYAGSPEVAELLVRRGVDVNARNDSGESALTTICYSYPHGAETARVLLKHGADPNAADHNGRTPLMAAWGGDSVDVLIEYGAKLDAKTKDGASGWKAMNLMSDTSYYDALVKHALVFDPVKDGPELLNLAAGWNQIHSVNWLLSHGVNPNMESNGSLPLSAAIMSWGNANSNLLQVCQILLEHGAKASEGDVLAVAASKNRPLAELLKKYNALPISDLAYAVLEKKPASEIQEIAAKNAPSTTGNKVIPFYLAIQNGDLATVKLFVQNGADLKTIPSTDPSRPWLAVSPVSFAAMEGHDAIVAYLLEHGAKAQYGDIAYAMRPGQSSDSKTTEPYENTVKLLIAAGALKNITDDQTVLLFSSALGSMTPEKDAGIVKLLLDAGLNPNARTNFPGYQGKSAIDLFQMTVDQEKKYHFQGNTQPLLEMLEKADEGGNLKKAATDSHDGYVTGQLVDQNGIGISQVQVRDYREDDSAVTDQQGHFALPCKKLENGSPRIFFASTGAALGWADFKDVPLSASENAPALKTIVLPPRDHVLHGTLIDTQGHPVQNATVWVDGIQMGNDRLQQYAGDWPGAWSRFWNLLAAQSGANGEFALSLPHGATATVKICAPGYGTLQFFGVDSSANDLGALTLPDGGDITGKLVDTETGKPMPGLVVRANRKSPGIDVGSVGNHLQDGFLAVTDKDGNFNFKSVRIGTYEVEADRNNCGVTKGDLIPGEVSVVEVKAKERITANLAMVAGRRVTGRILMGSGGKPVIQAYSINFTPARHYEDNFWSHDDGTFTTYLLPGTYELKVDDGSDKFGPVQVTVDAIKETAPVTLRVGDDVTTITIKVRTANGKSPSNQMFIWAWAWDGQNSRGASCSQDTATFRGIKKDAHFIFIVDISGYAVWQSKSIDAGSVTSPLEAVLQPATPVSVKGRIVDDATGKSIPNMQVSVTECLKDGIRWNRLEMPNNTDKDGRFVIPGLRVGDRIRLDASIVEAGTFRMTTITDDPSGMFNNLGDHSEGVALSGTDPIQLPDTHVQLLAPSTLSSFNSNPLPPLHHDGPPPPPMFWGIGVILNLKASQIEIQKVLPSGPAAKAGIQLGDILSQIDGKTVTSLADAANSIRGPSGTTVRVGIKRQGTNGIQEFTLTRENIGNLLSYSQGLGSEQTGHDVDFAALAKITLPAGSSRDQIRDYIRQIAVASQGQKESSSTDPQVQMLEKIGPDNINLLLEKDPAISAPGTWEMEIYTQMAINQLARDQDKDLIIGHLEASPGLIQVITNHNWQQLAKPIIVAALKKNPARFSPLWFSAAVAFHDPELYPDLEKAFAFGPNKYMNFQELKNQPGFDLKGAVDEAWKNQVHGPASFSSPDRMEDYGMAVIASQYGHLDALEYLFKALAAKSTVYSGWPDPRSVILGVTQANGTNDEIIEWYQKNKDRLKFDQIQKKFILQSTESTSTTNAAAIHD